MIDRLKRRLILVSAISIFAVELVMLVAIFAFNITNNNRSLDALTDAISSGNGRFPDSFTEQPPPHDPHDRPMGDGMITPETPFSTRHFTVWLSTDGDVTRVNTDFIRLVDAEEAKGYASEALSRERERGWLDYYRYKVYPTADGIAVVFVDGTASRHALNRSLLITAAVLVASALVVLLLIVVFSRRAVKPIAEGYEKQKQFITDANHELKTPLTLILTNLDIAEAELGKNEWLDDIRSEGQRMAELVNRLVALSRMDEESQQFTPCALSLSELARDALTHFSALASDRGLTFDSDIAPNVEITADEDMLRSLITILLDNAIKYCDPHGNITVTLKKRRHTVLTVENDYSAVDNLELDRLFDRFYRADRSRTYVGGYGIGLSIAREIAIKHRAELVARRTDAARICFEITFK